MVIAIIVEVEAVLEVEVGDWAGGCRVYGSSPVVDQNSENGLVARDVPGLFQVLNPPISTSLPQHNLTSCTRVLCM